MSERAAIVPTDFSRAITKHDHYFEVDMTPDGCVLVVRLKLILADEFATGYSSRTWEACPSNWTL